MTDRSGAFLELLASHRSIRRYKPDPLDPAWVDGLLQQCLHGSSSSGNLNMVSVVKTTEPARRQRLYELHGEQPMILEAPLLLTFCADSHRTRAWLELRQARPGFADLLSWHVAAFDAMILAQTVALALEAHGLAICYMGTTLFAMQEIADFLELPAHCLPATTLVVGHPAEELAQRDRLPPTAWIHDERYHRPQPADIERDFGQREVRGRARYMESSPEMRQLWEEHGITSLAQYYTSRIKYDPDVFREFSEGMAKALEKAGFMP